MLAYKHCCPALLALSLLACNDPTRIEELTFDEPIEHLDVNSGSGDIIVVAEADRDHIEVEAVIRGDDTRIEWTLEDGTLHLDHDCPVRSWSSCSVDWYLWVPQAAHLDLDLASGSGDIRVLDTTGFAFDLETGSGDVTIEGCEADDVEAFTGSGDVEVSLSSRPRRVALDTGSGDVRSTVPGGAYRLDLDTGSGDIDVHGLSQDVDSDSLIQISTGSGDIIVNGS